MVEIHRRKKPIPERRKTKKTKQHLTPTSPLKPETLRLIL